MFDAIVRDGRAWAEVRMTSTARVRRLDPATKVLVDGMERPGLADVYTGRFRLGGANQGSSGSRTRTVGGVQYEVSTRTAHFPYATTGLRDGDILEITAGENKGLFFRLIEVDRADQQTAIRVPVEATKRPEGWV